MLRTKYVAFYSKLISFLRRFVEQTCLASLQQLKVILVVIWKT
jgi:hypothetical protein